jgi:hypothetical protein
VALPVVAGDVTTVVMKIAQQTPCQAVFIATGSQQKKIIINVHNKNVSYTFSW